MQVSGKQPRPTTPALLAKPSDRRFCPSNNLSHKLSKTLDCQSFRQHLLCAGIVPGAADRPVGVALQRLRKAFTTLLQFATGHARAYFIFATPQSSHCLRYAKREPPVEKQNIRQRGAAPVCVWRIFLPHLLRQSKYHIPCAHACRERAIRSIILLSTHGRFSIHILENSGGVCCFSG